MIASSAIEPVIREALGRVFPAAQVTVWQRGEIAFSDVYGWLDPETRRRPVRPDSLFDLASVTKLFVVAAFMTLVEEGLVGLDEPVRRVLPDFDGVRPIRAYEDPLQTGGFVSVETAGPAAETVDAGQVTFRHLLTHTSGLPAWRPLFREAGPEAARRLALTTFFAYPIAARAIYSDIGLILLGMSVEQLTGQRLDEAVAARVTAPLGLEHTRYLPAGGAVATENIAPTEMCGWRGRRIVGEVHDENAAGLGGITGHAGLFSTADDVAAFGQSFLNARRGRAPAILRAETVAEMVRLQAEDGMTRRGLGLALWCSDPEASGNPFDPAAFGHTGFTGTSLWVDPARDLVVACLTNRVYYGRAAAGILKFRVDLHRAIVGVAIPNVGAGSASAVARAER